MVRVSAQKIPKAKPDSSEDILARFCYYFPQYKFHEARKLPFARIIQMLKVARKCHAEEMIEMLQITNAPHTKKQAGVKNLLSYFQKIIEE